MRKKGETMDYKMLNRLHRQRINQISKVDFEMEWENPDFMEILMGKVPSVRHYQRDNDILSDIW